MALTRKQKQHQDARLIAHIKQHFTKEGERKYRSPDGRYVVTFYDGILRYNAHHLLEKLLPEYRQLLRGSTCRESEK